MIAHPKVKNLMVRLAESSHIKYQLEVLEAGGTDAGAIHLTKSGVPSGTISIPCRYVHSPSEMIDLDDVQNCVDLVLAICRDPSRNSKLMTNPTKNRAWLKPCFIIP